MLTYPFQGTWVRTEVTVLACIAFFTLGWLAKGCYSPTLGSDPVVQQQADSFERISKDNESIGNANRESARNVLSDLPSLPEKPAIPSSLYEEAGNVSEQASIPSEPYVRPGAGGQPGENVSVSNVRNVNREHDDGNAERITDGSRESQEGGIQAREEREQLSSIQRPTWIVDREIKLRKENEQLRDLLVKQDQYINVMIDREKVYQKAIMEFEESIDSYVVALAAERQRATILQERVSTLERSSQKSTLFAIGPFAGFDRDKRATYGIGVVLNINPIIGAIF